MTTDDKRRLATEKMKRGAHELVQALEEFASLLPKQAADRLRAMTAQNPDAAGMYAVEALDEFVRTRLCSGKSPAGSGGYGFRFCVY